MDLSQYYAEFLTIALVHFLAVASPGPDFAVIVKQSLTRGRRTAIITSLGVGTAILLHVTYSLIGIGLLISQNPMYFTVLSYIAAAYLFYIGMQGLRAKASHKDDNVKFAHKQEQSSGKAFLTGFLVNGLNVKATLFFVSLFSLIISAQTPTSVQAFYGGYMAIATAAWFSFLSVMLTIGKFREKLLQKAHVIDRFMGIVLIALAIKIVLI
ncbi:LysE family translocator [Thalassotalea fonticola]|uniref:LysE family translocator n=1 Tax=Thalassotalea fonticola TaxID=3065649 RepID=A0ABZ0GRQ3_9GAMM|nr:LysE family translocator [Colwelliaceae bacterium S1-1]